jgi:hypothetical protein
MTQINGSALLIELYQPGHRTPPFVRSGSRLCENSNARRARRNILDRLRFIRTYNTPDIWLDAMLENYIFYISRMYEFSHSLGHSLRSHPTLAPTIVRC